MSSWTPHPLGAGCGFGVGPLRLGFRLVGRELRVGLLRGQPSLEPTWLPFEALPEVARFPWSQPTLQLVPRTADRPVVARTEPPLLLPAGEDIDVYLSTPLWLGLGPWEVPVDPPSDTWFGPSTIEGELGYASRTKLRSARDELLFDPDRAFTKATLRNNGTSPLEVERLLVPVRRLGLFQGERGVLWTEDLIYQRVDAGSATIVPETSPMPLVTPPRVPIDPTPIWAFGTALRQPRGA